MHAVTLMSVSCAVRPKHPSLMAAFNALFDRVLSNQAVTLVKGSVAARLEDPLFMPASTLFATGSWLTKRSRS